MTNKGKSLLSSSIFLSFPWKLQHLFFLSSSLTIRSSVKVLNNLLLHPEIEAKGYLMAPFLLYTPHLETKASHWRNLWHRQTSQKMLGVKSHVINNFPSIIPWCISNLFLWYSSRFLHHLHSTHFLTASSTRGVLKRPYLLRTPCGLLGCWCKMKIQKPWL